MAAVRRRDELQCEEYRGAEGEEGGDGAEEEVCVGGKLHPGGGGSGVLGRGLGFYSP